MDFSILTDEAMQRMLEIAKKRVSEEVRTLKTYEQELERRLLEKYWKAHPDLTPVNVRTGDDLLTVRAHNSLELMPKSTVTVTDVVISNEKLVYAVDCYNGLTGWFWDSDEVGKMREAYLKENPTES